MRAWIWKTVENIRQSYWFIPMLMTLGAVAMSIVMVVLDRMSGVTWLDRIPWLYANQASGARALLQTIAGSMITVAGVTFSITIAAVANSSARFGPRLMTNFMNDRGNQITFGTFVATFLYCLLVLRTVRGGDDLASADVFVPNLAVVGGLALAVASLGVLIYFIHHIPESIHISDMIARAGRELGDRIDVLYPSRIGQGSPDDDGGDGDDDFALNLPTEDVQPVYANTTGYVQHIESKVLMATAREHNLVLWIMKRAGDFAAPRTALVLARPSGLASEHALNSIRSAFVFGARRTPSQDILFLVDQLVEVAARALSPGVNDPFTAIYCIHWLTAALGQLAEREVPNRFRFDDAGELRVVAVPVDFEAFADAIFGQLRPYVQTDRNAALHALKAMVDLIVQVPSETQKAIIRRHCEDLRQGCESDLTHPEDRQAIKQIFGDAASRWGGWPSSDVGGASDTVNPDGEGSGQSYRA